MTKSDTPFWRTTPLSEMSDAQWESLCDGCGRCCLHKLEDSDTGAIAVTEVACAYLNLDTCRCKDYANRAKNVPDCVTLTATNISALHWMPDTCAYRLVAEGKDLDWWHPLVSGNPDTVHEAGISVHGKAISETEVGDLEDYVTGWLAVHRANLDWREKEPRRRSAAGNWKSKP